MHTNDEILASIRAIEIELEHIRRIVSKRDDSDFDLLRGPKGPTVSFDDSITNSAFDVKCSWPTITPDGNISFEERTNE